MLLLAGLGNPGPPYARHRHNVGFMAVDAIGDRHGFGPDKSKFQGRVREGSIGGAKALILKPGTYMNESGRAVGAALRFFKLSPSDVVVFYDELDLAPFKVRTKTGGGHAGHNGVRSIHAHIGPDYRRVRIGIGHPGSKDRVTPHVLGDFAKAEEPALADLLDAIARAAPFLAEGEDERFQTEVARLAPAGGSKPRPPAAEGPGAKREGGAPNPVPEPAKPSGPFDALRRLVDRGD